MLITNKKDIARQELYKYFEKKIIPNFAFTRAIVSFQENKNEPFYNWFKYKEAFSSKLVKYLIRKTRSPSGKLLDPFAGIGTALFASQEMGWESTGIELLPVGTYTFKARNIALSVKQREFENALCKFIKISLNNIIPDKKYFEHVSITNGAFPSETENKLNAYLSYCETIPNKDIQFLFKFAAFTILEEISYTRKDGQYLRWDHRAKRRHLKTNFNKGVIHSFEEAIRKKLMRMNQDMKGAKELELFANKNGLGPKPSIYEGSTLTILPKLESEKFELIITSPPYNNRYDYTRTYALELAFLGVSEQKMKELRQKMLSCTVENKEKINKLEEFYKSIGKHHDFNNVMTIYRNCDAMTEINQRLDELNRMRKLNNTNIPRMVRNYFLEMCFVIFEMARLLYKSGLIMMVNDNVRYGGEEIPVDIILSSFAESFNLSVNKIWVLPNGKGNSSQQMGNFGKKILRKCVYVWEKK